MEVDASIYRSPKRKRGQATHGPSLITSGLPHGRATSNDQLEDIGSHSPSTRVTGKLQKLDIRSPIDLPPSVIDYNQRQASPTPATTAGVTASDAKTSQKFTPLKPAEFTFESPVLKTAELATDHPHKRIKSPPPSSVVSDQFWQASEITGWTPGDPDEDNYGIDGVGYAKPASKAWAISQKRKQQIADYRSRETREARQRRHEKRLSGFNSRRESPRGSPRPESRGENQAVQGQEESAEKKGVRFVHFEDG